MKKITLMVVGLRHRVTPPTMREIEKLTPVKAKLEREPENVNDENAVKVILLEKPYRNFHIGYLTRETAAEFAPKMDKSRIEVIECYLSEVDPEEGYAELLLKFNRR